MVVYVLTRTDNFGKEHRIVEGVYVNKAEAETARQKMLKDYNAPSKLCWDTEISEHTLIGATMK